MAITITRGPDKFSPSDNPVIWQFVSDNPNIYYFQLELIDHTSNATIAILKSVPKPDYVNGDDYNLSRYLSNYVKWEVDNDHMTLVSPMTRTVLAYRVKITEKLLSGTSVVTGAVYDNSADVKYVFNASFDNISFNSFDSDNYVIGSTTVARFLTYKPSPAFVNNASTEFLYFLQDGVAAGLQAQVRHFNSAGALQATYTTAVPGTATDKMYRLNVSPKSLKSVHNLTMSSGDYYTVQVVDANGAPKTETKKYIFNSVECHLELVNVLWVNSIGGVDSYQFVNPTEASIVKRTSTRRNTYRKNGNAYTNISDGIYNPSEEILNAVPQVTAKLNTRTLSDQEVFWLGELVNSRQVFVELTDGKLLPAVLATNNFNYQRTRYLKGELNVMTFEIQFAENFVPALSNGSVSYIVSTAYRNADRSAAFQKQGCSAPQQVGSFVVYSVPAGTYTSVYSQADANAQADADIAANGQAYANAHGTCLPAPQFGNQAQSGVFYSTTCPGGQVPVPYTYTVAANTYFAYDLASANALAVADVNANGQAAADANGTCTAAVGNQVQSAVFYSTLCAANETPDPYTYTVPANTYFSNTQLAANQLALNDIQNNGQADADANGTCSLDQTNTIELWVTSRSETVMEYYENLYFTVWASAAVTDNITVDVIGFRNGNQIVLSPAYLYNGNFSSGEILAGQFALGGDINSYHVEISAVSPNPDVNNTHYEF